MNPDALRRRLLQLPGLGRLDFAVRGYRRYWFGREKELRLLGFLTDPARAAVDVGANRGYYTFWLMRHARFVYAYEPNPANLHYLRFARGNVSVRAAALSERAGQAAFRVYRVAHGGPDHRTGRIAPARATASAEAAYDEFTVPVRRLDDEGLDPVGFIKIDVEGHEMEVLAGARGLIARDRPTLLMEIGARHTGRPALEDVAGVEALGYLGLALTRQGLRPAGSLAPERHLRPDSPDYVFNYLFLPR